MRKKTISRHYFEQNWHCLPNIYSEQRLYEVMGKNKEAIELFQQLKDKFPRTERGFTAEKYLGKLGATE